MKINEKDIKDELSNLMLNHKDLKFNVDYSLPFTRVYTYKEGEDFKITGWIKVFETSSNNTNIIAKELLDYLNLTCEGKIISEILFIESLLSKNILALISIPAEEE